MAINKITDEQLHKIRKKSAKALPDRPTREGYSAEQIKSHLADFVLDDVDSFKAEVDRIVDETNKELEDTNKKFDGKVDNVSFENRVGEIYEEMGNVSMGDGKTFNYARKMCEESKNKFDISKLTSRDSNFSVTGESIVLQSNKYYCGPSTQTLKELANLEIGKSYILSFNKTNASANNHIYLANASTFWNNGSRLTITQAMLDSKVGFYGTEDSTNTLSEIMISENGGEYNKYNPNRNITNDEAEFLKEEFDTQENVLDLTNSSLTYTAKDTYKAYNIPIPNLKDNTTYRLSSLGDFKTGLWLKDASGAMMFNTLLNETFTTTDASLIKSCEIVIEGLVVGNTYNFNEETLKTALTKGINIPKKFYGYNSASHITNEQADLLKSEREKSLNEFNAMLANGVSGIIVSDNGKTITMPITEGNGGIRLPITLREFCPNMKVGETYTLNFIRNYNDGNNFIYLNTSKALWAIGSSRKITQDDLDGEVSFYGNRYSDGYTQQITMSNFTINKGNIVLPYQDWNGKILHPKDIETVVVWENGNPNIGYIPTGESIPIINIQGYKYFYAEFKPLYTATTQTTLIQKYAIKAGGMFFNLLSCYARDSESYICSRNIQLSNYNSLIISNAYKNTTINNECCIPVKFYVSNY